MYLHRVAIYFIKEGGRMEGARKINPLQVRLPPDLREWLKQEAEINHRSMNSEIVLRLEASRTCQEHRTKSDRAGTR
jgi:hypothetical protein